ncbi:unnamed protein product [Clonostachys solani]|uniref:DHHA2 domain-containing protein n=1 Tax=Clonostachys solani TaxID=160281 RepID=A0A9N9ZFD6_9HYPO|nr:unnamed protein product [Clonostachys solani]
MNMTLRAFLAAARAALAAPPAERTLPLTFVVGNESADLDSLCSAVVYAYLRTNGKQQSLHIPLSNLPRADLALRTEMTAVLKDADLTPSDLLTLSELPDLKPEDTRWLLIDHNSLTGPLRKFESQVIGCIDHHVDEGTIPRDRSPRIIEPCGSCMSLVIEESKKLWEAVAAGSHHSEVEKLARLALAPVLIDTINLTAKDKTKPKDRSAAEFLQGKMRDEKFHPDAYYKAIEAVKEDISELSFRDIFRKDYKEWTEGGLRLGISCAVQNFDYLLHKTKGYTDEFFDKLGDWAKERELDIISVMTTSHPGGEFQRHLLVWARGDEAIAAVQKFVKISGALELQPYEDGKHDKAGQRLAWRQKNLAASRKQVSPLLREAMKCRT